MRRGACAVFALLLVGASARWPWQKQQPDGGAALLPTPMSKFRWPWQRESSAVATTTTICQGKSCPADAAAANPTCSSSGVAGAGSCVIPMLPAGTWDGISWIIDPSGHLSDEARDALEQNLTQSNRAAGPTVEAVGKMGVKELTTARNQTEGVLGNLRSMIMPIIVVFVLLFMCAAPAQLALPAGASPRPRAYLSRVSSLCAPFVRVSSGT